MQRGQYSCLEQHPPLVGAEGDRDPARVRMSRIRHPGRTNAAACRGCFGGLDRRDTVEVRRGMGTGSMHDCSLWLSVQHVFQDFDLGKSAGIQSQKLEDEEELSIQSTHSHDHDAASGYTLPAGLTPYHASVLV